ncbi:hypothetical protein CC79DRAFT_1049384 [Sarocladium strictum]
MTSTGPSECCPEMPGLSPRWQKCGRRSGEGLVAPKTDVEEMRIENCFSEASLTIGLLDVIAIDMESFLVPVRDLPARVFSSRHEQDRHEDRSIRDSSFTLLDSTSSSRLFLRKPKGAKTTHYPSNPSKLLFLIHDLHFHSLKTVRKLHISCKSFLTTLPSKTWDFHSIDDGEIELSHPHVVQFSLPDLRRVASRTS